MLTSRVVGAEEADRIGFVTRVVPHDRLDAEVAELAAVLASKPPGVMRLGRESFYAVLDSAAPRHLPYLHAMLTVTSQTAEARRGDRRLHGEATAGLAGGHRRHRHRTETRGDPLTWRNEH